MPEFDVSQAKSFVNNKDDLTAEYWYREYKEILFNIIKNGALLGLETLTISSNSWNNEVSKEKYLLARLTELGYTVEVENATEIENMVKISWQ